jgi:thiosulfate/3-mercaptopyruvate sulfurtransferase
MNRVIEPDALAARADRDRILLVQVTKVEVYARGHIPGAVHVDPRFLVGGIPPAAGLLPDVERLEALFGRIGYRPDQQIVACDDEGGGWAGRFIWTLDMIGHGDWLYLNGGMQGWLDAGFELLGVPEEPTPTRPELRLHDGPRATAEHIMAHLGDRDTVIWDARSRDEYEGRKIAAARGGHIPGAVHLDWLDLMDPARALRLREDLEDLLGSRGITRDKRVITHCQTHHRSGLSYMAARCLGFPHISAYDGSWSDWGNRADTPIVTGPAPGGGAA